MCVALRKLLCGNFVFFFFFWGGPHDTHSLYFTLSEEGDRRLLVCVGGEGGVLRGDCRTYFHT